MKIIDFRSDTVTRPTNKMRKAMANAEVGDDVYQDDPTVIKLEELAAKMLGKESALFVPSGTFSNQLAVMTHTNRGDEIILEKYSHIKAYEVGGVAALSGVNMHTLPSVKGKMNLEEIKSAIRDDDIHHPNTSLICLENAYNGIALDLEYMSDVYKIAKKNNINVHLDGARIFNAATSLDVKVSEIAKFADSISVCLSKGLCAPIGSILVGDKSFINKARKYRKMLGGGMRQVGILAAPGIIALEEMSQRLHIDHENAKYLASKLNEFDFINVDYDKLDINMVFCKINSSKAKNLDKVLEKEGILIGGNHKGKFRFACHNDIDRADIDKFIERIEFYT